MNEGMVFLLVLVLVLMNLESQRYARCGQPVDCPCVGVRPYLVSHWHLWLRMVAVTATATGTRMSTSTGAAMIGSMMFLLFGCSLGVLLLIVTAWAIGFCDGSSNGDDDGNDDWQHGVSPVLVVD